MTKFCDCIEDGYCSRYHREMRGRFREICAGVNVDLGTAAEFRDQWAREAALESAAYRLGKDGPRLRPQIPLLLVTEQAPGDAVVATAAIYSLHRAHLGKYITWVKTSHPQVFAHSSDVAHSAPPPDALELRMHYPAIHDSNWRGIHVMQAFCEHLGRALGVSVPLMTNRPRLYFQDPDPPVGDFWLVCSGGKCDFTCKLWGHHNYQEVVDSLKGKVRFVQVGASEDDHQVLSGVEDRVGSTSLRGLFNLTRCARGVLCGVSLLMHVAAALDRPAVVVAGGREPLQWNAYPRQQYLHTVGATPCSDSQGNVGGACWRSRVVPLGDSRALDKDTCLRPVGGFPECMSMIRPVQVAELILRYDAQYDDAANSPK